MASLNVPRNLKCEFITDPLGIDVLAPHFSWELTSEKLNAKQTAYQILIADTLEKLSSEMGNWWDTGKVLTDETNNIEYAGLPLCSEQRLYWTVRVWDGDDVTPYSSPALFEMGLLEGLDGNWIGADESIGSPLFRRSFTIERPIARARAYICGLGYYELRLNGRKVGTDVLVPNWTDYDKRNPVDMLYPFDDKTSKSLSYITYDITAELQTGPNAVGVILGNGWYNQRERTIEGRLWYDTPRLLVRIVIEYADGCRQVISSDESWLYSSGPIIFNNIFFGEVYDARLEEQGWDSPGFEPVRWRKAEIVRPPEGIFRAQSAPPDRVVSTIKPITIVELTQGTYICDFGRNYAGWVRLQISGSAGSRIVMRFAETLHRDGSLDFTSTGGDQQIQQDIYICSGRGVESYEPRFTWHGFRYMEIIGLTKPPGDGDIIGCAVNSDVETIGRFQCSNEMINVVQEAYCNTQLSNYHCGVPSDCPHRERLGYTGDGQLTAGAAMFNFWVPTFYRKWLRDIADAQNSQTGFVPHTAPFYGGGGGPAWGSAIIIVPWELYLHYGDTRVLEDHYPNMVKWVGYLGTKADDEGIVVSEEPGSWCLGDWSWPTEVPTAQKGDLPPALVNTSYYALCTRTLSKIARILGRAEDAAAFLELSKATARAVRRRFWDDKRRRYSIGSRGADLFGWLSGAVRESEIQCIAGNIINDISENGGHLDTGILGTPLLFELLAETGHADIAVKLLTDTSYPSYGYMLSSGSGTLWENWSGSSRSHPMFGSVSEWFYRYLAGIQIDWTKPAFKEFSISPALPAGLDWVSASLQTIRGLLVVDLRRDGRDFTMNVTIPVGAVATINLPSGYRIDGLGKLKAESGTYHIKGGPGVEENDIQS